MNQYKKFVIEGLKIFSLMYNGNYNIAISVAAFLKLLETILFNPNQYGGGLIQPPPYGFSPVNHKRLISGYYAFLTFPK